MIYFVSADRLWKRCSPKSVAVIGATEAEGSVGRTLIENLKAGNFGGEIIPVNLKRARVLGIAAFPKVGAVKNPIDLAVIVTPAATVPGITGECAEAGVKGAIIISAGFRECGAAGVELEKQVLTQARRAGMEFFEFWELFLLALRKAQSLP